MKNEIIPSGMRILPRDEECEKNGHAGTQLLVNPKGKETFRLMWGGLPYEN